MLISKIDDPDVELWAKIVIFFHFLPLCYSLFLIDAEY